MYVRKMLRIQLTNFFMHHFIVKYAYFEWLPANQGGGLAPAHFGSHLVIVCDFHR